MRFGPLASAGLALALSGCNGDDLSRPPVVDRKFPVREDGSKVADADLKSPRDRPEFPVLVEAARESRKDRPLAEDRAKEDGAAARKAMVAAEKPRALAEIGKFQGFPFSFVLPDVDGKSVALADFRGKVTVVDIWGTWCPPCKEEIPHLVDLHREYADKGLAIVGINFEQADRDAWPGLIRESIKEYKIPYPCLIGEDEVTRKVPDFRGYPTTLFLDRGGKVRYQHVGYAPIEQLESIVQVLLEEGEGRAVAR